MPHIYRVAVDLLPEGLIECQCCGEMVTQGMVGAFDEDMGGYLCLPCVMPMAMAEFSLVAAWLEGGRVKARRPDMMESMRLDDIERRALKERG